MIRSERIATFAHMGNELGTWLAAHGLDAHHILQLAFGAMMATLFLQWSLDKLFNWKGEKEFLTGHFAKSVLRGTVPMLLPTITLMELLAGTLALLGGAEVLLRCGTGFGFWGMVLGAADIIMLFFGQRVAKDYAGAASLVPYFLMCAAGVYVFAN